MVLAIAACIYMACNIGANDVANAMGTSVGSGSLTFKQAIYVAAVAEFAGAFFVGGDLRLEVGHVHINVATGVGVVNKNLAQCVLAELALFHQTEIA